MSSPLAARAAFAALFGAIGASFPYLPLYYRASGLNLAEVGLVGALAAGVGLLAAPLWGSLADRSPDSRWVLPAAATLATFGAIGLWLASGPIAIAVAATGTLAAQAGVAPILDARALDIVRGNRDGYGRLRVWGSIAFVVVSAAVGFLVERSGIASLFWAYLPLLAVTAIVGLLLRGEVSAAVARPRLPGIARVLRQPDLVRFLAAAFVVWSASMAVNAFLSIRLVEIGAPGELVGAAWAIGAAVEVPVMWAYPALAARVGGKPLLLAGAAMFVVRAAILPFVDDPVLVASTMALHGVGFGLVLVGGVIHVSRLAPPGAAATAQGALTAVVFSLSLVVGPGLGGPIAEAWGLPTMFGVAAAASLGGALLLAFTLARAPAPG